MQLAYLRKKCILVQVVNTNLWGNLNRISDSKNMKDLPKTCMYSVLLAEQNQNKQKDCSQLIVWFAPAACLNLELKDLTFLGQKNNKGRYIFVTIYFPVN